MPFGLTLESESGFAFVWIRRSAPRVVKHLGRLIEAEQVSIGWPTGSKIVKLGNVYFSLNAATDKPIDLHAFMPRSVFLRNEMVA